MCPKNLHHGLTTVTHCLALQSNYLIPLFTQRIYNREGGLSNAPSELLWHGCHLDLYMGKRF